MTVESEFIGFSADKLLQLMGRIEAAVAKLSPEQVWTRAGETQNAVGNLLLHLDGNVRQWILHGVFGQPDHRDRDREFAAREAAAPAALLASLRATVEEAAAVIRTLPPERLTGRIDPQGYEATVLGAIYHVVEHFSGHAFQIFLLTKAFTGEDLGFYAYLNSGAPPGDPLP
jgi:uncharacterized damage-inducible protein DinB